MADKIINTEEMNRIANEMANSVNSKSLEEIASVANSCVIASLGSLEDAGVSRELAKSVSSGYAGLVNELQSKASNYQERIVEINKNMQKARQNVQNYNNSYEGDTNNRQGNNTAIIQDKSSNSTYVSGVSTNNNQQGREIPVHSGPITGSTNNSQQSREIPVHEGPFPSSIKNNQQSNNMPASSVIHFNPQKRPVTGSVEKLPNYDVNSRDKIVNLPNYDVNSRDKIVNYSDRSVIKPNVANSSNKSNINISKTI